MAQINSAVPRSPSGVAIGQEDHHHPPAPRPKKKSQSQPPPRKGQGGNPKVVTMLRRFKWHWIINGLILASIGSFLIVFEFGLIPFRIMGYRCQDIDLSHKYRGNTISFVYLLAVCTSLPLTTLLIVEFIKKPPGEGYFASDKKRRLVQALKWYGQFLLGFLLILLFVQLCKSIIAEPRPHFFDSCRPDKMNCSDEYITDFKCTNYILSDRVHRDSFRSFPSGHSALGVYTGVFLTWYLQVRVPPSDLLLVTWFQCLFLSWGLLCALTRITDRRHHWWDVLAGSIIGIALAIYTVKSFCRGFKDARSHPQDSEVAVWDKKGTLPPGQTQDPRELREVK